MFYVSTDSAQITTKQTLCVIPAYKAKHCEAAKTTVAIGLY